MRNEMIKQAQENLELEKRMEKQISDCSFWMQKYTEAYKENEIKLGSLDSDIKGKLETL